MPTRQATVAELISSINIKLASLEAGYADATLRDRVLSLVALLNDTKRLGIGVVRESGCDAIASRERLRLYLVAYTGVILESAELEVVSGISEYARRVRELRVEDGYKIVTGAGNDPSTGLTLRASQYVLLAPEPDRDAAHRWHLANRIRRESTSAQDKLLKYLRANVRQIVTSEELAYVAKISDWPRRVRELRTELGYAVSTRFTGRPDLRSGEYVLESVDRVAEPHDRHIPADVQQAVYQRDHNVCCLCEGTLGFWTRLGSYTLELHHIQQHAVGGSNLADNLLVLCNACHDDVHAGRVPLPDGIFDTVC